MPVENLVAGSTVGAYEIIQTIATGGMGTVYLAKHRTLGRTVALKLLRKDADVENTQQYRERLRREAQAVAAIRHPNVVEIYDANVDSEPYYLVMELLTGGDLQSRLRAYAKMNTRMPIADALKIAREVASALDFAHQQKFVHRDIKPSNIMFAADGRAILTDFGIVALREGSARLTKTQTTIGTPAYMSPEQAQGIAVDGRSDLYSLGIVLFEMLTGRTPFGGDDTPWSMLYKHIKEVPPPIGQFRQDLPPAIATMVELALRKEPERRFQTGSQMIAAIDTAMPGVAAKTAKPRAQLVPRNALIAAAVLASVLACAAIAASVTMSRIVPFAQPESQQIATSKAEPWATATLLPEVILLGSAQSNLYADIPIDGDPVTLLIPSVSNTRIVSFTGVAGQSIDVYLRALASSTSAAYLVRAPDGSTLTSATVAANSSQALHVRTLPSSGRYQIEITGLSGYAGEIELILSSTITAGRLDIGKKFEFDKTSREGQSVQFAFAGVAGKRYALVVGVNNSIGAGAFAVVDAENNIMVDNVVLHSNTIEFGPLKTTADYLVRVDPYGPRIGPFTVQLLER